MKFFNALSKTPDRDQIQLAVARKTFSQDVAPVASQAMVLAAKAEAAASVAAPTSPDELLSSKVVSGMVLIDDSPSIINPGAGRPSVAGEVALADQALIETLCQVSRDLNQEVLLRREGLNKGVISNFTKVEDLKPFNKAEVEALCSSTSGTPLYSRTETGIGTLINYEQELMSSGRKVKNVLVMITDGMNNDKRNPADLKKIITDPCFKGRSTVIILMIGEEAWKAGDELGIEKDNQIRAEREPEKIAQAIKRLSVAVMSASKDGRVPAAFNPSKLLPSGNIQIG